MFNKFKKYENVMIPYKNKLDLNWFPASCFGAAAFHNWVLDG